MVFEIVPSARSRIAWTWAVLAAWLVGAIVFAWRRIPFNDEWYSITLARDTTWHDFRASLVADSHPPWIALLDRALMSGCPDRRILCLPRVAASLMALVIMRRVVLKAWPGVGPLLVTLAAFHPLVFFYAGAVRWYPFAFLADALRSWAIWGASKRRDGALAFLAGAVVGVMSGYGEGLLVAVDACWLVARRRDRSALRTAAFGVAGALATVVAAPIVHAWPGLPGPRGAPVLENLVEWAIPGPLGSVIVPWPFTPIVVLALPGLVWGLLSAFRDHRRLAFACWLATVAASWAALSSNGIRHPRYSLALWYLTTCTLGLVRSSRLGIAARTATASYLAIALWLTIRQRDFIFNDENVMTPSACAELVPDRSALVVSSYLRTAEELQRVCAVSHVVSARNARIYAPVADLDPIRDALRDGPVTAVYINAPGSAIDNATRRLRALLSGRCTFRGGVPVAQSALTPIRRIARAESAVYRYTSERWDCGAARQERDQASH